jgi:hypothetical protein
MRRLLAVGLAVVALVGCQRESEMEPLSEYESADLQARAYNFQVYPGARFLQAQTDVLRRAHFVIQPKATEAPPMAMYDSEAPLDQVANFYAERYGYQLAANSTNNFSSVKPNAYYTGGDLTKDVAQVKPILDQLKMNTDISEAKGEYRGVHIDPSENMPRVTLQRPYFDVVNGQVVDRTLILMVRE